MDYFLSHWRDDGSISVLEDELVTLFCEIEVDHKLRALWLSCLPRQIINCYLS